MTAAAICLVLAAVDVSVTTTDGDVVEGKLKLKTLKMKTEWGAATIRTDQVAEIVFGDPDIVVTRDRESQLRGKLALSVLRIETAAGTKTLRRDALESLVAMEGGRPLGAANFHGAWMASYGRAQGPMKLTQTGLDVKGTYGHRDQFSIEGTVKGRTLTFRTREGNASGEGTAELWEDGSIFIGKVGYGRGDMMFAAYGKRPRAAKPTPGAVTEGQSDAGLIYFLRVPKAYDGKRSFPAIVITHGSNANSKGYVETFPATWPKLAEDYIVIGVNGERLSSGSRPGNVGHNASYVEFGGPGQGQPWRHRQTPTLLTETVRELKESLKIGKAFLGGHSQGGFLTYATFLYYPDDYDGAFPMACNLLVQCEPDRFTDPERVAKQHRIAVAPIHGRADTVVAFSGGEYCYARMQEHGFPRLRFFAPEKIGHGFMFLPVEEAVRWLETMTSDDAKALVDFAAAAFRDGRVRDATGALLRARELGGDPRIDALLEKIDAKAAPAAARLEKAIRAAADNTWVDDFWEFRREFAHAPSARACLEAYAALKAEHTEPANKLFWAARRERDKDAQQEKYKEILDKYYASGWWILVRDWVK